MRRRRLALGGLLVLQLLVLWGRRLLLGRRLHILLRGMRLDDSSRSGREKRGSERIRFAFGDVAISGLEEKRRFAAFGTLFPSDRSVVE